MKSASKSVIARMGENPLDAITATPSIPTRTRGRSAAEDGPSAKSTKKVRATIHIPENLFDEVRDAVVALSGPPDRLTLAGFAELAFRTELERLKKLHTKGRAFQKRAGELRGGRPIGS